MISGHQSSPWLEAEVGASAGLNLLVVLLVPHRLNGLLGCDPLGLLSCLDHPPGWAPCGISRRPEVIAQGQPGRTLSAMVIEMRLKLAREVAPRVSAGNGAGDRTKYPDEVIGVLLGECVHSLRPGAV
jgi:hypothetical protein